MITYQLLLNGKLIASAGASDLAVLTQILSAVGKLGSDSEGPNFKQERTTLELTVSGMTARKDEPSMHVSWVKEELKIGDEFTVKIIDADVADAPSKPGPPDWEFARKLAAEQDKIRFESAKSFYLANKIKYES